MAKKKAENREHRITMEIIVDANGPEEQAMGWYYCLADTIEFPFTACWTSERAISPLQKGDEVEVINMAPEAECLHEMFVMIRAEKKAGLAVPLAQLVPAKDAPDATQEAVTDWLYWVGQGYEF